MRKRAPESAIWGRRTYQKNYRKALQTRKDGLKLQRDYVAEGTDYTFETAASATPDNLGDRFEARLRDATQELLDRTGTDAIYQKMQLRMPDGSVRWISKKRLREPNEVYTASFFRAAALQMRAYGASLIDFNHQDENLEDSEELGEMKFEILGFDVETVVEGDYE